MLPIIGLVGAVFLQSNLALAFEDQWHAGGGLGFSDATDYRVGPALNAYGAYGISDVFDVRLEAQASHNVRLRTPSLFYAGKFVLAYKVDVIEWIPYLGLSAGVLGAQKPFPPFRTVQPLAGLMFGLDYAVTRSFGLGLALNADYAFTVRGLLPSAFVRAEHRFGW